MKIDNPNFKDLTLEDYKSLYNYFVKLSQSNVEKKCDFKKLYKLLFKYMKFNNITFLNKNFQCEVTNFLDLRHFLNNVNISSVFIWNIEVWMMDQNPVSPPNTCGGEKAYNFYYYIYKILIGEV